MAELTDRYVFVSGATATALDAYRLKIDLGPNNEQCALHRRRGDSGNTRVNRFNH